MLLIENLNLGRINALKKTHEKVRKRGGEDLRRFLEEPFRFPDVTEYKPKPTANQRQLDGLTDAKILRSQNLELHAELSETKAHLK